MTASGKRQRCGGAKTHSQSEGWAEFDAGQPARHDRETSDDHGHCDHRVRERYTEYTKAIESAIAHRQPDHHAKCCQRDLRQRFERIERFQGQQIGAGRTNGYADKQKKRNRRRAIGPAKAAEPARVARDSCWRNVTFAQRIMALVAHRCGFVL